VFWSCLPPIDCQELDLTEAACANAMFIHSLFPQDGFCVEGLPFVCKRKDNTRYSIGGATMSIAQVFAKMGSFEFFLCVCVFFFLDDVATGLEDRDSFGSLSSSFLALPSIVRINAGSGDDETQLFERFYAAGKLLIGQKERSAPCEITEEAIVALMSSVDAETISALLFGVQLLGPRERFYPHLERVLKSNASCSRDSRRILVEALVKYNAEFGSELPAYRALRIPCIAVKFGLCRLPLKLQDDAFSRLLEKKDMVMQLHSDLHMLSQLQAEQVRNAWKKIEEKNRTGEGQDVQTVREILAAKDLDEFCSVFTKMVSEDRITEGVAKRLASHQENPWLQKICASNKLRVKNAVLLKSFLMK
jgi:hypothetical protein